MLTGFNATDKTLCDIKSVVAADFAALQYQNEKNTSALIQAGNANTAKVLEFLTNDKLNTLQTDLALAKAEISQRDQTQNIVNQLKNSCGCGCGCGCGCACACGGCGCGNCGCGGDCGSGGNCGCGGDCGSGGNCGCGGECGSGGNCGCGGDCGSGGS